VYRGLIVTSPFPSPHFLLHGRSISPRSLSRLQSNRLGIRHGGQKRLNQALTPANPLRPTYNTPHGNSMRIRKRGWLAREWLQRRQCLFVVGELRPVEKGWDDHGKIMGTRVNFGKSCGVCHCIEIGCSRGFWRTCSPDGCGHHRQEREN
jgi:hypothetical protein